MTGTPARPPPGPGGTPVIGGAVLVAWLVAGLLGTLAAAGRALPARARSV